MKHLITVIILILFFEKIFSQSMGPNNPMSASYSAMGCLACPGTDWNNLSNITYPDHQNVETSLSAQGFCFQSTCYYSRILYAYNFGFNIPAGAVITGVKAEMISSASLASAIRDSAVQLYSGTPVGSNHADTASWSPFPVTITYGDSNDTWNYALTPDTINSQEFGFSIRIVNRDSSATVTAAIDNVSMTVYYSTGTGVFSQTRSAVQPSISYNKIENSLKVFSGEDKILRITLIDIEGKKIIDADSKSFVESETVYLPELSQGIYFAVMQSGKKVFAEKIFISK